MTRLDLAALSRAKGDAAAAARLTAEARTAFERLGLSDWVQRAASVA